MEVKLSRQPEKKKLLSSSSGDRPFIWAQPPGPQQHLQKKIDGTYIKMLHTALDHGRTPQTKSSAATSRQSVNR